MTLLEFCDLVAEAKAKHRRWFEMDSDPVANSANIETTEAAIGAKLPEEYKDFVRNFGGGYFGLATVFSIGSPTPWNIIARNHALRMFCDGFVAVSENGVGDLYGFQVIEGKCLSQVWIFDHEVGSWRQSNFQNFFDFLAKKALQP